MATCTALLLALDQTTLASVASMTGGGGAWWLLREAMKEIALSQKDLEELAGFLHVVAVEVSAEALSASPLAVVIANPQSG